MDIDELAEAAATAFAEHLAAGTADAVVDLVRQRFSRTRAGAGALTAAASDAQSRQLLAHLLADEAARDPAFANALAAALGRPSQVSSVQIGRQAQIKGDVAGGNIDKSRRYHIGSIRFGGGGLTALIVAALLGTGGAGLGLYKAVAPDYGDAYMPDAQRRTMLRLSGDSVDLDASNQPQSNGDGVSDLTLEHAALIATGGAVIVRLPAGQVPERASCDKALQVPTARIESLKPGDLICVRTSRRSLAAMTISDVKQVNQDTALWTTFFKLDWAYWTARKAP